ncbi:MAG: threonine/serine dehydratase [Alphaproteobacteria bacterium]|nr:threonine/serine dehydratase [Alphaproteobacteria bacterium]
MTSSPASEALPTIADVAAAAGRLAGVAVMTPLLESDALNRLVGGRVLVKAEALQKTGSFKIRGAYNHISQLDAATRRRGIVSYSSGNHAQGVAAAAALVGVGATIVMPADAPAIKVANTRAYGAEVVFYDRYREVREEVAARLAAERGAHLVPPYEDPHVIAGQGTVGLELAAQAAKVGARLDAVLVPCGGGGLTAGCALALAARAPGVPIYAVEPEAFDDTRRSLATGARATNPPGARSICDALLVATPGAMTFAINRTRLAGVLVISDDDARHAMRVAAATLKLVVEPGGAAALAALLSARFDGRGRTVAVVVSGGNVDPAFFGQILAAPESPSQPSPS